MVTLDIVGSSGSNGLDSNFTKSNQMITLKLDTSHDVFSRSEGFIASHVIQKCIKKLENFDKLEDKTYYIRDKDGNVIGSCQTSSGHK